jgi:hypothetical protein
MTTFSNCPIIQIDGSWLLRGIAGLTWAPDAAARTRAEQYEQAVERILRTIQGASTGREFLNVLYNVARGRGQRVTISPFVLDRPYPRSPRNLEGAMGQCNAASVPANEEGALRRGVTGRLPSFDSTNPEFEVAGNGRGSDGQVFFDPFMMTAASSAGSNCASLHVAGETVDSMLLHELVHVLRGLQGHQEMTPCLGIARSFRNNEEFICILVQNIYLSERGAPNLRGGHDASQLLPPLNTSTGFLQNGDIRACVSLAAKAENSLFAYLSAVTRAPFNPIREYWNHRAVYDRMPATAPGTSSS